METTTNNSAVATTIDHGSYTEPWLYITTMTMKAMNN